MKKLSLYFCAFITTAILASSCTRGPKITRTDTETSGVAQITVDECLAPIIDEQIQVFEALNYEAAIVPLYTNERNAYDLFVKDSVRLIIGTRELTTNEQKIIESREQTVWSQPLAVDGIALIVNKANKDTLISTHDIKRIINGEITSWKELYPDSKLGNIDIRFDSPNSSTVRFITENINDNKSLAQNVKAISNDTATVNISERTPNQRVIDYVSENPNALGLIGVNWISNPSDSLSISFINNVKVMSVSKEEKATKENSYKPLPYQFSLQLYPLQRIVYIIISDSRGGLTTGFVKFAAGEKGQRIVYKAGLLPASQPVRLLQVRTEY